MDHVSTVLVVEDELDLHEIFIQTLSERGIVVMTCSNLRQAKQVLNAHRTVIDHVICDNWINGDGPCGMIIRQICDAIGLPCLVMSGEPGEYIDLEKPFSWDDLVSRLLGLK